LAKDILPVKSTWT